MNKYIIAGLYAIGGIGAFSAGVCADRLYRDWQERKRIREATKKAQEILERIYLNAQEQTSEQ